VLRPIQDIIVFDTEYTPRRGAVPESICLAAQSVTTGQTWGWWREQLATRPSLPFRPDELLLVASTASGTWRYGRRAVGRSCGSSISPLS
jgi:hypothetical protein